jgi:hypothetical protein
MVLENPSLVASIDEVYYIYLQGSQMKSIKKTTTKTFSLGGRP